MQRFDSKELIEKRFDHSLPRFVAAFLGERKLSEQEADELTKLIDTCRAGRDDG